MREYLQYRQIKCSQRGTIVLEWKYRNVGGTQWTIFSDGRYKRNYMKYNVHFDAKCSMILFIVLVGTLFGQWSKTHKSASRVTKLILCTLICILSYQISVILPASERSIFVVFIREFIFYQNSKSISECALGLIVLLQKCLYLMLCKSFR